MFKVPKRSTGTVLLAAAFLMTPVASALAAPVTFYNTLTQGRADFDARVSLLGAPPQTDRLTGLTSGVSSWARPHFTITAATPRSVTIGAFSGSVAAASAEGVGESIEMTAFNPAGPVPGSPAARDTGLTFAFASPVNAFAVELHHWATCCFPTALYMSFDGGAPILVGSASTHTDNPGHADGTTTFIGAINDVGTFSTVGFWGEAAGGDWLHGGGVIRWALVPVRHLMLVYPAAQLASNWPAFAAARVIDANPALLSVFADAGLETDAAISTAASQTLPLLIGNSQIAIGTTLGQVNQIVDARMASVRGLSSGEPFMGDKTVWLRPFGSWANQSNQGAVSGFEANTGGAVLGVERQWNPSTHAGLAFAWSNSDIDSKSTEAPSRLDVSVYQLVAYGTTALANGSELGYQFGVGQARNSGSRSILFTNQTAASKYDSTIVHAGVNWGRNFALGPNSRWMPSIRADYTHIRDDGYTETGAGDLNLNVAARQTESLVLGLDARYVKALGSNSEFSAHAGVGYDTKAERAAITATFAGAPGAAFVTPGINPEPWRARAGIGYQKTFQNGMEILGRYDLETRSGFTNQTLSVRASWAF